LFLTKNLRFLAFAPLCWFVACSAESPDGGGTGGTTSTAGNMSAAGAMSAAGSTVLPNGGSAGTTGAAGSVATGGTTGAAGTTGTAGTTGVAGTTGAGGTTGAAGSGAGGMGAGGYTGATGKSAGCNKQPGANDTDQKFVLHEIHLTGVTNPAYLAGGKLYTDNQLPRGGKYDYQFRPYSVRLPKGYDPSKSYAVVLAGGGCGGNAENFASNPGGGYQPDNSQSTIQVGLSYLAGCFDDGGRSFADNNWLDTPEIPYVRQVIEEVENNYCVDKSLVFESGTSSGGWESYTTGCGLADHIRAIGPVSGGLRLHRPECSGKQAAIMVEALQDTSNPIGPLDPPRGDLDSTGSAPARDEILKRNGCVAPDFQFMYTADNTKEAKAGNAPHDVWDPAFPSCVKYTGCPAEYPVVWCALPCGHQCDNETVNNVKIDYKQAIFKFWSSLPPK
jgi:hypothetical protein